MNSIPVFLPSDNNYAPFVATTIASICFNTKSFIDFYILDGGITSENKEKICALKNKFNNFSIEFLYIDPNTAFKDFKTTQHLTKAAYNRFLMAELKPDINQAIYLDSDLIVKGDIIELWNQSLDDKTVAWIKDQGVVDAVFDIMKSFDLNDYYNAGVLLIDLKKWRDNRYTEKIFDLEHQIHDEIKFADQDLLNILLKNDCKCLEPRFNVQYGAENTLIRHFVNVYKPWKFNYFKIGNGVKPLVDFDDFWNYVKMTEFYDEVHRNYENNINSNFLNKRLSQIAEKMKQGA